MFDRDLVNEILSQILTAANRINEGVLASSSRMIFSFPKMALTSWTPSA